MKACLLGRKTATLNAQVTFVHIAVDISFCWGGPLKKIRTEPLLSWCFRIFGQFLGVAVKERIEMEYWLALEGLEIY